VAAGAGLIPKRRGRDSVIFIFRQAQDEGLMLSLSKHEFLDVMDALIDSLV
jgi:hypothetical protein